MSEAVPRIGGMNHYSAVMFAETECGDCDEEGDLIVELSNGRFAVIDAEELLAAV
jgi:hypothetical protein